MPHPSLQGSFLGIGDTPTIQSIVAITERSIRVTFSEAMASSITSSAFYSISPSAGSITASVISTSLAGNGTYIDLTLNNEMTNGISNYSLTCSSNVVDLDD